MFRREVKPLGDIVQHCLRSNGLETPLLQKRLMDSWAKVVGRAVAKYTGGMFIKNQTLFVKVLNPALRADLSMMRERFINQLNKEVGCLVITEIRFY